MMERFFNTAGPVRPEIHYCLPPLERLSLADLLRLIHQQKYFVLHAPRQTGKTSTLLALMEYLNQQGQYRCLYVNVEVAQSAREDVHQAMDAILNQLGTLAQHFLNDPFPAQKQGEALHANGGHTALNWLLTQWAAASPQPLVLLIDEIDALIGDTLIAVLRQLRAGYTHRPTLFPQSVVLCGVRDVRDYRIHSAHDKAIITGGSAFNIKAASLRMGDFSQAEVERLYQQHTAETGQLFEPAALEQVWFLTQGQPWLVNALAYEVCFEMEAGRDRSTPITADRIISAKERLILRRETHLDQLTDKLQEERVRRVIEPILAGQGRPDQLNDDDVQYVLDLGLIRTEGELTIANEIYREVIPRTLVYTTQLTITHKPAWYIGPDGRLDMAGLLAAFQQFFREHSESWLERFEYREAGPQLLMQAFLQRIVNSGGRVEREYGLGRGRTDLLVIWPYPGGLQAQRTVIELKVRRREALEAVIAQGLAQTWEYMDRCGAEAGHLLIFDRNEERSWEEKLFVREAVHQGTPITVWEM